MKIRKLIAFCILAAPVFAADGRMTDTERTFLVEQLELTKKNMLASIATLTDAQWKFKPAPDVWSAQECAEHIILAEDLIFNTSQQMLKTPATPRLESATPEADRKMTEIVQDRSKKGKAPEILVPGTKYATPADAAREFTVRRDRSIAYAKSTNDDLRAHTTRGPTGLIDAYQFLLTMAAHSGRHTLQIREVTQ